MYILTSIILKSWSSFHLRTYVSFCISVKHVLISEFNEGMLNGSFLQSFNIAMLKATCANSKMGHVIPRETDVNRLAYFQYDHSIFNL